MEGAVTKGKVDKKENMLHGMTKRAGKGMETKDTKIQEQDCWCDEKFKRKKKKKALKVYRKK
jgi:hypothetical protein